MYTHMHVRYMPPEILADSGDEEKILADGTKWDVFSYAVMVTYILRRVGGAACLSRASANFGVQ